MARASECEKLLPVFLLYSSYEKRYKGHINNLLTSSVRSLREISDLGLEVLTSLSLGQYIKASV